MALVAVAGWAVGGAVLSLLNSKRAYRKGIGGSNVVTENPRTPRSIPSDDEVPLFTSHTTPPRSAGQVSDTKNTRELRLTQRSLMAGTVVCFYNSVGELMVVKPSGKLWHLQSVSSSLEEGASLSFFPPSSVFVVVREGDFVGFKSYGAGGRLLQAVTGEQPHRAANLNFGSWEKWHLTSDGYINRRWGKSLGYEIQELRCVSVDDMRRLERRQLKEKAKMEEQAQIALQRQIFLEDEVHALQCASARGENEAHDLNRRIGDLQQMGYKIKMQAEQRFAVITQLEGQISVLAAEKQETACALREATAAGAKVEAELLALRAQFDKERHLQEEAHARQMHAVHQQKDEAVEEALAVYKQKEETMVGMLEQLEQSVTLQAEQLSSVSAERDRLDIALKSISGQMEGEPDLDGSTCPVAALVDAAKIRELRHSLLVPSQEQQPCSLLEEASVNQSPKPPTRDSGQSTPGESSAPQTEGTVPEAAEISKQSFGQQLLKRPAPSSTHSVPLGIALGSEKLMLLLNSEPPPGVFSNIKTPRVMTPRLFARTMSDTGECDIVSEVGSGT